MAKQLINEIQIKAAIVPKLRKAARYVADELYKRNKELIESIVYASYTPTEYVRSGQFKEAWETKDYTMANNNGAVAEFSYDPSKLSIGAGGQHSSLNPYDGSDVTPYLAEIIYDGLSGAIYEPGYAKNSSRFMGQAWAKKRDVWDALNDKLGKKTLRQYFEEGMRKQGIAYRRNRTGGVQVIIEK